MTIVDEIIDKADPFSSLEAVTDQVVDALLAMEPSELREELQPLARNAVRLRFRGVTRSAESGSPGQQSDPAKARRDLLDRSFFVSPERGYVLWGEATIDDHLVRAASLRQMAGGLVGTAEKHEDAVKLLKSKGAKCLFELGQVAA